MPMPPLMLGGSFGGMLDGSFLEGCSSIDSSPTKRLSKLNEKQSQVAVDDFYDLVSRLTSQYDRERSRCDELRAENARLRSDLRMASATQCAQRLSDPVPESFELKRRSSRSRNNSNNKPSHYQLDQDVTNFGMPPQEVAIDIGQLNVLPPLQAKQRDPKEPVLTLVYPTELNNSGDAFSEASSISPGTKRPSLQINVDSISEEVPHMSPMTMSPSPEASSDLSPEMCQEGAGPQRRTSWSPGRRKFAPSETLPIPQNGMSVTAAFGKMDHVAEGKASAPSPRHMVGSMMIQQEQFLQQQAIMQQQIMAQQQQLAEQHQLLSRGNVRGSQSPMAADGDQQSSGEGSSARKDLLLPPDIGRGQGRGLDGESSAGSGSERQDPTSDNEDEFQRPTLARQRSHESEMSELSLLPLWTETKKGGRRLSQGGTMRVTSVRSHESGSQVAVAAGESGGLLHGGLRSGDVIFEQQSCLQKFMLNPNGFVSMAWDLVSVVFVFYDLITIPLQVFDLKSAILDVADLAVAVIWTVDIYMSFVRGITDGGAVDMRPSRIANKYVRSWFVLDAAVVMTDWMLILSSAGGGDNDNMEFLSMLRGRVVLRMLRIFRLVRIMKLVNKDNSIIKQWVVNENSKAVGSVCQLLCAIVLINHYVGCGWYAVGQIGFKDNWIVAFTDREEGNSLSDYLISIHWAVTQFTPAAMNVVPINTAERAYTVVIIFFGLVLFSSFVSNMTSAMNHLNKLTSEQRQRSASLRQYIADNRVSLALLSCILSYQRSTRAQEKKRLHEKDVAIFKMLPEDLLQKLHEEVYAPVISQHPLFAHLAETEESTISSICHLAMMEKSLVIGEELFRCGVRGTKMYFVNGGTLAYFLGYDEQIPQLLSAGSWMCEPVLWSKWQHRGRLTIATAKMMMMGESGPVRPLGLRGELMVLDAAEFHTIMSQTRVLREMQTYARVFAAVSSQDCGGAASVDDLWGTFSQVETCLKRAFGLGEEAQAASKLMMLWDNGENTWQHCFSTWKLASKEDRERRRRTKTPVRWFNYYFGWLICRPRRR
eukprot:gb/GFBE01021168.1/.p1 GENE.gb/GFBE01021168.1/~~gb/GFBE01021168.1/.p1  ORF type:complete len:1046 (+),score=220.20 gb/GFBE01021168.1/:1-3138(+)